jgi:hypothetical protein
MSHLRLSAALLGVALVTLGAPARADDLSLWTIYESTLRQVKYVDPTHAIAPDSPVWSGFGPSTFGQAKASHGRIPEAPLAKMDKPLRFDPKTGLRVR